MRHLQISGTQYSPNVDFDPEARVLSLSGVSRPENTIEFYEPVLAWLEEFLDSEKQRPAGGKPVQLDINMDYINSISVKYIMGIILQCQQELKSHNGLSVNWYYVDGDEEGRAWGEEIGLNLVGSPKVTTFAQGNLTHCVMAAQQILVLLV